MRPGAARVAETILPSSGSARTPEYPGISLRDCPEGVWAGRGGTPCPCRGARIRGAPGELVHKGEGLGDAPVVHRPLPAEDIVRRDQPLHPGHRREVGRAGEIACGVHPGDARPHVIVHHHLAQRTLLGAADHLRVGAEPGGEEDSVCGDSRSPSFPPTTAVSACRIPLTRRSGDSRGS